ncbi:hypothetical protein NW767_014982 [Fusarium falciforme]|nr:hypothetical protein NW767_014982 [Fusarium falciforme]
MSIYANPLDSNQFRLAAISLVPDPDNDGSQIPNITLTTHGLLDVATPSYHALSYTWGKPRGSVPAYADTDSLLIRLDGHGFLVKPNLYDALLHIHQYCPQTPVWIDALCIDQDNLIERQLQVASMHRIFGDADLVIVWLGKPFSQLRIGLEIADRISDVASREVKRIIRSQKHDFTLDLNDMPQRYGLDPFSLDDAEALFALYGSHWFSRVWVIQEVALAKNAGVLCNNNTLIPFDKIGMTATFLHLSGILFAVARLLIENSRYHGMLEDLYFYQAEKIQLLREWCKGDQSAWLEEMPLVDFTAGVEDNSLFLDYRGRKSTALILLKLLMWTFGFESADRRDSVYGLWGILQHIANAERIRIPESLKPNYEISTATLFESVTEEILASGNLTALTLVADASMRQTSGLPSWCPEFPIPLFNNPICGPNFKSVGRLNASGPIEETPGGYLFGVQDSVLHVRAFSIGPVELVGESLHGLETGNLSQWIRMLLRMDETYPPTAQPALEAFWRIIICDQDMCSRPAKLPRTQGFRDLIMKMMMRRLKIEFGAGGQKAVTECIASWSDLDKLAERDPSNALYNTGFIEKGCCRLGLLPATDDDPLLSIEEQRAWLEHFNQSSKLITWLLGSTLPYRSPVLTTTGYLGLALRSTRVGDEIWILAGCPMPVVLRKVESDINAYRLIGEVYVHGIMHGEAVTGYTPWQEIVII